MTSYRETTTRTDTTLWYGPFAPRAWLVVVPLVVAVFFAFALLAEETGVFRRLECHRPGVCTVFRGSDLFGVRTDRPFASSSIVTARHQRTQGKHARDQLLLVGADGSSRLLLEDAPARRWHEPARSFFEDPSRAYLLVRVEHDPFDRLAFGGSFAVALVIAVVLGRRSSRAGARFRVSILREDGMLRVERMRFSRPRDARWVALPDVKGLWIERLGNAWRIVLITRVGPDFPLTERYFPETAVHTRFAATFREELGIA